MVRRIVDHADQRSRPTSPARIIRLLLHELENHIELFPVNQLVHSLQTATRAVRDNASDELVFAALMHDVGKVFSGPHHAEIGAALVRAYVWGPTYQMLLHHPLFRAGLKRGARTQMVDDIAQLEQRHGVASAAGRNGHGGHLARRGRGRQCRRAQCLCGIRRPSTSRQGDLAATTASTSAGERESSSMFQRSA
jgi:HD domain